MVDISARHCSACKLIALLGCQEYLLAKCQDNLAPDRCGHGLCLVLLRLHSGWSLFQNRETNLWAQDSHLHLSLTTYSCLALVVTVPSLWFSNVGEVWVQKEREQSPKKTSWMPKMIWTLLLHIMFFDLSKFVLTDSTLIKIINSWSLTVRLVNDSNLWLVRPFSEKIQT